MQSITPWQFSYGSNKLYLSTLLVRLSLVAQEPIYLQCLIELHYLLTTTWHTLEHLMDIFLDLTNLMMGPLTNYRIQFHIKKDYSFMILFWFLACSHIMVGIRFSVLIFIIIRKLELQLLLRIGIELMIMAMLLLWYGKMLEVIFSLQAR